MATAEFKATIRATGNADASTSNLVGGLGALSTTASVTGTDGAALNSAIATAVADGASPTQAHVTAINNAWTTYKADVLALTTAIAAITADVTLYIGSVSNVATKQKLRNALDALYASIKGSNLLTD